GVGRAAVLGLHQIDLLGGNGDALFQQEHPHRPWIWPEGIVELHVSLSWKIRRTSSAARLYNIAPVRINPHAGVLPDPMVSDRNLTMRFCPQCGASLMPGAKFCVECGASLTSAAPSAEPAISQTIRNMPLTTAFVG